MEEDRQVGSITLATMYRSLKVFGGVMIILLLTLLTGAANFGEYAIQYYTI